MSLQNALFRREKRRRRCGIITPVTNPKRPEELSEQELRRLLLDKRHDARQKRLERFRRSGRAVLLSPDLPPAALDEWRTQPPVEGQDTVPESLVCAPCSADAGMMAYC